MADSEMKDAEMMDAEMMDAETMVTSYELAAATEQSVFAATIASAAAIADNIPGSDNISDSDNIPGSDNNLNVTLIDAIPCNLRDTSKFLASRINVTLSEHKLRLFLRCYGFLMYDKTDKIAVLRKSVDPRVRKVADILDECKTLADFKISIREHLEYIKAIISDPNAVNVLIDDAETCPTKRQEQQRSGLQILNLAKKSLEYVFAFIHDSDHLRRSLNVNEYCRRWLLRHVNNENTLSAVYNAWHNSVNCDLNDCLSIVFRDIIVTTGMQTQSTLLFVVRASLMLTFLVTNFMCRHNGIFTAPRITVTIPKNIDSITAEIANDYWENYDGITIEKFVATVMISMTRMYLAECVEWPKRIREASLSISLKKMQTTFTKRLSSQPAQHGKALVPWLRVMRRSRNNRDDAQRHINMEYDQGGGNNKRLYVNFNTLLGFFEQLSSCVKNTNTVAASAAGYDEDTSSATALDLDHLMTVRITNQHVNRQWNEYEHESRLCIDAIVQSLNESAVEAPTNASSWWSLEQFVTNIGTTYRDRDDDLATVASSSMMSQQKLSNTAAVASHDDGDAAMRCDEIDVLSTDIGSLLLFAILSLVRYDVKEKRYDSLASLSYDPSRSLFDDETYESHKVLLVYAMSQLCRAKMTLSQVREFFTYLTNMWHSQIGIVSLEQLSEILYTMYRMFPPVGTAANGENQTSFAADYAQRCSDE